jgi:16S rRNA (adenine1518-N6/adenine1519-N6)-dimethyltransferase
MRKAIAPKWGQHFLKDLSVCRKIVNFLTLQPDDLAVEIGPGRGIMTRLLAPRAPRLLAIEIDPSLAEKLAEEFTAPSGVEILCADILTVDLSLVLKRYGAPHCYVFGNLPYYITSPIVRHLFAERAAIRHMTLLMQREVAERVTAEPGSRAYGYLSLLVQINSSPRIVLGIPPGAFSPPPKVHSALVDFPIAAKFPLWKESYYDAFLSFAQLCFRQKRKSLLNNLAQTYSRPVVAQLLASVQVEETIRAEQLSLGKLAEIFKAITNKAATSDG